MPLKGSWILDAPESVRIAFLQGLADGDGHASVTNQEVGVASICNQHLIGMLLQSLGVKSRPRNTGVLVRNKEAVLRLGSLPLFKHSTKRRENLQELVNMMLARLKRRNYTKAEMKFIIRLHRKGMSYGKIAYELWKTHRISRSPSALSNFVTREMQKKNSES